MSWKEKAIERYKEKGGTAFAEASDNFRRRLEEFCKSRGITIKDDNPEGRDWLILLADGTELYVERRSYETDQGDDFWVEFDGAVKADFESGEAAVIVAEEEIAEVLADWRE